MSERHFYVYMLTNSFHNVLYTGFTNNLSRRIAEHQAGEASKFTNKYNALKLVYYELHHTADEAIKREKQIKKWKRLWKDNLVKSINAEWNDLLPTLLHDMP